MKATCLECGAEFAGTNDDAYDELVEHIEREHPDGGEA